MPKRRPARPQTWTNEAVVVHSGLKTPQAKSLSPAKPNQKAKPRRRKATPAKAAAIVDLKAGLPKLKALSVRQPFAEQILRGGKVVEYRNVPVAYRGPVYIYASQYRPDDRDWADVEMEPTDLPRGMVVGIVEVVGCHAGVDGYEWDLANPRRLPHPIAPQERPQPVWFYPFGRP